MEKNIERIRRDLQNGLTRAGKGYLTLGLEHFHKKGGFLELYPQVLVGNLAIAVELLLKAFVASRRLDLLYTNLPLELRAALACPELLPPGFKLRPFEIELRGSSYQMVDLAAAISIFGTFFPDEKRRLGAHLRFIRSCRNASVHALLPSFQRYELDRTAYVALRICEVLKEAKALGYLTHTIGEDDRKFLETFDEERITRVHKGLAAAREKAKNLHGTSYVSVDGWDVMTTTCPVCDNEGVLEGASQLDPTDEEYGFPFLSFVAYSFQCEECGLVLNDTEELELAGMEVGYDRNDELNDWLGEQNPGP